MKSDESAGDVDSRPRTVNHKDVRATGSNTGDVQEMYVVIGKRHHRLIISTIW